MSSSNPHTRAQHRALARPSAEGGTIYTARFWRDLGERVVTSAAGGALAVASAQTFVLADPVSWASLAAGAGTAALVSFLKGIAAARVGSAGTASLDPAV